MRVSDIAGPRKIDLNVDIGEGFPNDRNLLEFATSANICCGVHAGCREMTLEAIAVCKERGVRIGAHPGYPDRSSMGRESVSGGHERLYLKSVFEQVQWFNTVADCQYLKPHGGFYNDTAHVLPADWEYSQRKQPLASRYENGGLYLALYPGMQSLSMMLRIYKLPLMGLEVTAHKVLALRADQSLIREGFADRTYQPDGTLTPRTEPGALIKDLLEVREQVLKIAPFVDSICLHGDNEDCVEYAELVYMTLTDSGYEVAA